MLYVFWNCIEVPLKLGDLCIEYVHKVLNVPSREIPLLMYSVQSMKCNALVLAQFPILFSLFSFHFLVCNAQYTVCNIVSYA